MRPPSPTLLLKQIVRNGTSTGEHLKVSMGNLSPLVKKERKKVFLCFHLCPLLLVLSPGTTEKSLAPSYHQVFIYIMYSLNLLFSRLNKPTCLRLSEKQTSPMIIFVALCWIDLLAFSIEMHMYTSRGHEDVFCTLPVPLLKNS